MKAFRCIECTLLRCDAEGQTCEECVGNRTLEHWMAQNSIVPGKAETVNGQIKWKPGIYAGSSGQKLTELPDYIRGYDFGPIDELFKKLTGH